LVGAREELRGKRKIRPNQLNGNDIKEEGKMEEKETQTPFALA